MVGTKHLNGTDNPLDLNDILSVSSYCFEKFPTRQATCLFFSKIVVLVHDHDDSVYKLH